MSVPGFYAEASLHKMSRSYRSVGTGGDGRGEQRAVSQLSAGGGGSLGGGGGLGFWCEAWCDAKFAACLLLCPESGPLAAGCAALCYTEVLAPCLSHCGGGSGWGGSGYPA